MRVMVLAAVLLCGCMTTEELQARLDATCTGYGFARGSMEYKQCWMMIDQRLRQGR